MPLAKVPSLAALIVRCTHQGYTLVEVRGVSTGAAEIPPEFEQSE
jgi:hypothetical protein